MRPFIINNIRRSVETDLRLEWDYGCYIVVNTVALENMPQCGTAALLPLNHSHPTILLLLSGLRTVLRPARLPCIPILRSGKDVPSCMHFSIPQYYCLVYVYTRPVSTLRLLVPSFPV